MAKAHSPEDVTPALSLQPLNFSAEDPGVGGWEPLFAQARGADRAGIDRLAVSDHVILGEHLDVYGDPKAGGIKGSPTLGCWGDEYATTSHIDKLATQSVRYTRAFATAPVCSPSRSCLITGVYATTLGTEQMRSAFPVPNYMQGFPSLLREVGYYTSNNFKTDYNTSSSDRIIQASWDESSMQAHWRNRKDAKQPFFSVFNIMTSHQSRSMVWTQERFRDEVQSRLSPGQIHDPEYAPVPPYYPNNAVTRRIVARYYDCVTAMDQQVGQILKELEEDGLADNTIVFFYSDHGSGMPRHKRLLHDSGMHVPLLVRLPQKYAAFAPQKPGNANDQLVSFVDFPPTVLQLAGVDIPYYMQGSPFLGKDVESREYIYGHRDRIDEVFDLSRSVRDKRYLYIRNYLPHRSWNQFSAYSDMSEIRHELYHIAEADTMTAAQRHYAGPTKPAEELYDCQQDPQNLQNLAGSAEHAQVLNRLRAASLQHVQQTNDLGFIPESLAWRLFDDQTPYDRAESQFEDAQLAAWAADSLLYHGERHAVALARESNPALRYWGVVGLAKYDALTAAAKKVLRERLRDEAWAVRIEAAEVLARHGEAESALPVLSAGLQHEDLTIVLHATRTVEMLGEIARPVIPEMQRVAKRVDKLQASDTPAVFSQSADKHDCKLVSKSKLPNHKA